MTSHRKPARRSNQRRITESNRKKAEMKGNDSMKNFFRSFIAFDRDSQGLSLTRFVESWNCKKRISEARLLCMTFVSPRSLSDVGHSGGEPGSASGRGAWAQMSSRFIFLSPQKRVRDTFLPGCAKE
jgi:hypothetical protein